MATPIRSKATVGNPTSLFGQKAHREHKQTLVEAKYRFNPLLIKAIVRRDTDDIACSLNPTQQFHNDSNSSFKLLFPSQYQLLKDYYKDLLNHPVELAIKICNSENTETTQSSNDTRLDVLYCLAAHWDALIKDAEQKGHDIPDLKRTLEYAKSFEDQTSLYIFINGLSDEYKAEAAKILQPEEETFARSLGTCSK